MGNAKMDELVTKAIELRNDIEDQQGPELEPDAAGYVSGTEFAGRMLLTQALADLDRCIMSLQAARIGA